MRQAPSNSHRPPSAPSMAGGSLASAYRRPGSSIPIPITRSPARPLAARVHARASAASLETPSTPPNTSSFHQHAQPAAETHLTRNPASPQPSPSALPLPPESRLGPYIPAPISRAAASLRRVGSIASLKLAPPVPTDSPSAHIPGPAPPTDTARPSDSPILHPSGPASPAGASPQPESVLGGKFHRPTLHPASAAPYRIPKPAAIRNVTKVTSARRTQPESEEPEAQPPPDSEPPTVSEPEAAPETSQEQVNPAPRKRTISWFGRRDPSPPLAPVPMPTPVDTQLPAPETQVASEAQQYLRLLRDGPPEPVHDPPMASVTEEVNDPHPLDARPSYPVATQSSLNPNAIKPSLLRSLFFGGSASEPFPAPASSDASPQPHRGEDDASTSTAPSDREVRGPDSHLRSGWVWPFRASSAHGVRPGTAQYSSVSAHKKERPGIETEPMDITDVYGHPEAEGAENGTTGGLGSYLSSWLPGIPQWKVNDEPSPATGSTDAAPNAISDGLTPAEQIKRDALRRYGSPEQLARTTNALCNPDQTPGSDVVARPTWMSLLRWSTPSRPALPSTEENDGPEVMDLDADPNAPPPASSTASQSTAAPLGALKPTKGVKDATQHSKKDDQKFKGASTPPSVKPKAATPPPTKPYNSTKGSRAAGDGKPAAKPRKDDKDAVPPAPNLVTPNFEDTFLSPPRSLVPKSGVWERTMSYLFAGPSSTSSAPQGSPTASSPMSPGNLPKAWVALDRPVETPIRRVVVVGVHGWFTQSFLKTVMGEPTGTSHKFATMMSQAVETQLDAMDVPKDGRRVTSIPLHGDGKVSERVNMLYAQLEGNPQWIAALRTADAVFVAAHSQGAVVSVHLLARILEEGIVQTDRTPVCLLAMCGIHDGPFTHLQGNLASTYLHYFETAAAKELFEFQSPTSTVSQAYLASLHRVLSPPPIDGRTPPGVKILYVGSVDDQVVPLYSALNFSVDHPNVLRALYVNGQAFPQGQADFLVHLLSFLVRIRNAGLDEHGLLALLSSAVAGSVFGGSGHSLIYDEQAVYDLAVRYLFQVDLYCPSSTLPSARMKKGKRKRTSAPAPAALDVITEERRLALTSGASKNPYQLPWAFRGLLEDADTKHWFAAELDQLIDAFDHWQPVTKPLKDIQFRLQPLGQMRRLQMAQRAKARM